MRVEDGLNKANDISTSNAKFTSSSYYKEWDPPYPYIFVLVWRSKQWWWLRKRDTRRVHIKHLSNVEVNCWHSTSEQYFSNSLWCCRFMYGWLIMQIVWGRNTNLLKSKVLQMHYLKGVLFNPIQSNDAWTQAFWIP